MKKDTQDIMLITKFFSMPWGLISVISLLTMIGMAMLYSAAQGSLEPWAMRHFERFVIGFVLMVFIAITDIRIWFKYSYFIYFLMLAFLVLVEIKGHIGMGAQRWINIGGFNFQPSEMMKIAVILALARYFHCLHVNNITKLSILVVPILIVLLPVGLILIQPNLGTATVITMMSVGMFFVAGINIRKFVIMGALGLAALPVIWNFLMHDYQKRRVMTFLNPDADPLGAGYNIIQSKIAIGSGGFFGKGFLQGSQSQLSFLPEKQTDFIFTMLSEEFGMIGGLGIIALYAVVIMLSIKIAAECYSHFGKLICFGINTMLFLHVFINMAMSMGMIPVVGVPLPFLSYGGSNLLAIFIGFGFVLNAKVHEDERVDRALA